MILKKRTILIFLSVISILAIFLGIGGIHYYLNKDRTWESDISYTLIVKATDNTSFNISVPAVLDESNSPASIMNALNCTKNCSWKITPTIHGTALNIRGSGNTSIGNTIPRTFKSSDLNLNLIIDNGSYFHFDMWNDSSSYLVWIYCDSIPINSSVEITLIIYIDNLLYYGDYVLETGWQVVKIERESYAVP